MRLAIAIAIALGGCKAVVDAPGDPDAPGGSDGPVGTDGPLPDAAQPDAAPCTGGNAQATDGATCYEAFLSLPLAWAGAETVCEGRGGRLAKVDSLVENQMIAALVGGNRAWIGGTDLAAEGTFLWSDGTTFAAGFTNWRTGEPNNGSGNFEEDCALIEGQNGGTWDDRPCDTDPAAGVPGQYFYVCER